MIKKDGDFMVYNILGIIIGILALLNSILFLVGKKGNVYLYVIDILCSFGFIITGISGFFIPKAWDMIPVILLLVFAILYLVVNYILLKKRKNSQTHKQQSTKK